MITADGGGSNGSRVRLWKRELQRLANELGLDIVVHHLPPGTSKWNKIEHRLFSFITGAGLLVRAMHLAGVERLSRRGHLDRQPIHSGLQFEVGGADERNTESVNRNAARARSRGTTSGLNWP